MTTDDDATGRLSRRAFLLGTGIATGALVATTAGQTWEPLAPLTVFAPRQQGEGPQGVPVNRTAEEAQVLETAVAADWSLTVAGAAGTAGFGLDRLRSLPQTQLELPIACVEGWSTMARWRGVRLRDLLGAAGLPDRQDVRFSSLQTRGAYGSSEMGAEFVRDSATLVALELNGEPLHLDHGFPARVIAPARPGVLQTKWLSRVEVLG
ncbi:molybdopterin-dependent oxidoreductase [Ruania halotolerans]|uniref:molybdopterin-dependent oxidoreductase n=1 Tax=Ruania halotolerans TaxID=2897773 RepID=UPI001E4D57CC|nr:molybdopterin-dependent oxidoreductase [Ruania halotolerans]UFU06315.1 molybdopterin-dependent oxidoreductase [Ruania halotolerans]